MNDFKILILGYAAFGVVVIVGGVAWRLLREALHDDSHNRDHKHVQYKTP
jgi:hypothetical protein